MPLDPFALPEQLNLAEEFLYRQARKRPQAPALYFEDQVISYGQLAEATDRATAVYKALGLEQEQRVLLLLPDVPQFASAWLGAVKTGGVISAVNPDLKPDEVRYYLHYTRARIVVADAQALPAIEAAASPWLKHVLVTGGEAGRHLSYDRELERATPDPSFAPTHRDDPAVWLYTSGS